MILIIDRGGYSNYMHMNRDETHFAIEGQYSDPCCMVTLDELII